MSGETDLSRLLSGMEPVIIGRDWGYASVQGTPPPVAGLFATVAEAEGLTLIAPFAALVAAGLTPEGPMARITLTVHSALAAVGLTAAVSTALAGAGISANMVAGFYHDHIFLAADRADEALAVLQGLTHD